MFYSFSIVAPNGFATSIPERPITILDCDYLETNYNLVCGNTELLPFLIPGFERDFENIDSPYFRVGRALAHELRHLFSKSHTFIIPCKACELNQFVNLTPHFRYNSTSGKITDIALSWEPDLRAISQWALSKARKIAELSQQEEAAINASSNS